MYYSMSIRISLLSFKNFCSVKSRFALRGNSYLIPKHLFSSSHNIQPLTSETLQHSKYVQPFVNQSVDEVLSALNSKFVSSNESVSILKVLRMFTIFKNINADSFKQDERFKMLCDIFERSCNVMHPNLLVSGLRSLLEVGISPNSSSVISAEQSVINNINLFSPLNIIGCLYFHYKFVETDLQKEVLSILISELCKRVSEIKSSEEVLMLVHVLHIFKRSDHKKIQQRIVELIPTLNVHDICKIFNTLAENSDRNILILSTLSFYLQQKAEMPDIKGILDILYSFKKLNFLDMRLISSLLMKVIAEIPSVTQPSIISRILTTCGHLKLKHTGILISSSEWIINHIHICQPKEFVSFILAVAALNYNSPEIHRVLQRILPLTTFKQIKHSNVWLDVVWSLAVLNIVDRKMLLHVLSSEFYKPLIKNSDFQTATYKLKLMNLKAVLKSYFPECIYQCDLFLEPIEVPQSTEIQNNKSQVLKVLSNFIPKDKYLCENQSTDMGIFIDGEFIMNENLKPLPLSKFGILSKVTDTKPLPKRAQRIALLILFFKDFTLYSQSRLGFIDLAIRLLFAKGYTPVLIPFDEFMKNDTEVKKAKYLMQKISSIMKKTEDNNFKYNAKIFS